MAKPTRHFGKWRIRWVDENRGRHSEVYERRDDAVFKLREHEQRVAEIKRGRRLPDPPAKRFDDVDAHWMKTRAAKKRSRACDESILRAHLRPAFAGRQLSAIAKEELDIFCASKAHLHKNTQHHILTLLVSLFRMAVDLGWLRSAPKVEKPKLKLFSRDFHYLKTTEEVHKLLRSAHEEGALELALYATAIYTGMRQGELAGLMWSEVDLVQRLIIVAHSWDGPPKSEKDRAVPIVDALLPVLAAWRLRSTGKFVFPNASGGMLQKWDKIFKEAFHSTLDRAGFPKVERHGRLLSYVRFHDLRHTFATHWMMSGGNFFKLQHLLGHESPQMTTRYAHFAPDAYAADYGRFGAAMGQEGGKVLALPVGTTGLST